MVQNEVHMRLGFLQPRELYCVLRYPFFFCSTFVKFIVFSAEIMRSKAGIIMECQIVIFYTVLELKVNKNADSYLHVIIPVSTIFPVKNTKQKADVIV